MAKAAATHPLHDVDLATRAKGLAETLDALESLLSQVELAEPSGLKSKRRDFRKLTTEQQLLELRTEIALGAKLSRAGVEFDLETESGPSPDIHLRHEDFAIEVTARTSDGIPPLLDELEASFAGVHMAVHLRFSALPLRMQARERNSLIEKLIQPMYDGSAGFDPVPFVDSMNPKPISVGADVFPRTGLGPFNTKMTFEVFDQDDLEVRRTIASGILDAATKPSKALQGRAMRALVLVDVARWGGAWNRNVSAWACDLAAVLDDDFPYQGLAIANCGLHEVDFPIGVALRPNLAERDHRYVADLVERLRPSTDLEVALA